MPNAIFPSQTQVCHIGRARAPGWLQNLGLLNDYVRIPYANGSSFATQFLYREFRVRGHQVTIVGPDDPAASVEELPTRHICFRAVPFRNHPGVRIPLPTPAVLERARKARFDLVLGQTTSALLELGVYLRAVQRVPFLCVNTLHLPSAYNVMLPDSLLANPRVNSFFQDRLIPWTEAQSAASYNQSDGLIVLSRGLEQYWRERGVEVPIHVIPRSVDPKIFDRSSAHDPFDPACKPGARLLCVCRHTREKELARLIRLFAKHVAPRMPDATLTLLGDGPDHDAFRLLAERLGVGHRVFFPGEVPLTECPAWYRRADLFVYASLSETYGQVISEALWCGLPVVAFADSMGVSHQVDSGRTGVLVDPGPDAEAADRLLAEHAITLLTHRGRRRAMAEAARVTTRARVHPSRIIDRYYDAFEQTRRHCQVTGERDRAQHLASTRSLSRWVALHAAVAGFGCIRPPAVVNRHGRKQPRWEDRELLGQAVQADDVRGAPAS